MNSRRFICWTDIQTPQGGGLAHAGILTCPTRSGAASGAPDARVGSKAEELALSICCPLSRRKRTSLGRFATSASCQTLHFALQEKQRPFSAADQHEVGDRPAKR